MTKRVLVTGASRGIGRDIAIGFAREGASVIIVARDEASLEVVARELRKAGGEALPLVCDVSDSEQVDRLRDSVLASTGGVDILINNAGAAGSHKFLAHPDDLWHAMLAVNLSSVFYVTRAFAAGMIAQQAGRVINIASIAGKVGGKYIAAYTASKHGVLGLTRALAIELAPHVTVNAICPGYVDTPMTEATVRNIVDKTGLDRDAARTALSKESTQKRLIAPEEITALALFLAKESSRGITGQAINVDGGTVMW